MKKKCTLWKKERKGYEKTCTTKNRKYWCSIGKDIYEDGYDVNCSTRFWNNKKQRWHAKYVDRKPGKGIRGPQLNHVWSETIFGAKKIAEKFLKNPEIETKKHR